ncbi:hypothetical protein COV18_06190 [Candidatus Woesearchaeota archaeon CG10_big_fil_rev_8_21_14_0_10_37_12]|nr:MAG: hypothetical protein COV18_06190 [Candidatus Woesearchaeota archaeon CG10_big_fil_rev_8_21_14_0_10_37_12]
MKKYIVFTILLSILLACEEQQTAKPVISDPAQQYQPQQTDYDDYKKDPFKTPLAKDCKDECTRGQKQCVGEYYQTCGNFNEDSCIEWSPVFPCDPGKTCQQNECVSKTLSSVTSCGNIDANTCDERNKPYYCANGNYIQNCLICSCPDCYTCREDGTCQEVIGCTLQINATQNVTPSNITPNVTQCISRNCTEKNIQCGQTTDGCGNTLHCGTCMTGQCVTGQCTQTTDTAISACRTITQPGDYTLTRNIAGSQNHCVHIQNTRDVTLNCQGYSITGGVDHRASGLVLTNVSNFEIRDCAVYTSNLNEVWTYIVQIINSRQGIIQENQFGNHLASVIDVRNTSNLQILRNSINASYQQTNSDNNRIENNWFNPALLRNMTGPCVVISITGSSNSVARNVIDGKSNGIFDWQNNIGFDDGVCLQDSSRDIIEDNTISNVWDCGIETLGLISDAEINRNTIVNTGHCGIGAWHWSSWRNNDVKNNYVDDSPSLFDFFRDYGLRPGETTYYFEDNYFEGNRLTNPETNSAFPARPAQFNLDTNGVRVSSIQGERLVAPQQMQFANNVLRNNVFTGPTFPLLKPHYAFVDGGGNTCQQSTEQGYPIQCS